MTGLNFTSVTHAALMFAMVPIFVLVISRWTHMEALTGAKILGVLVAFGGVTVLTLPRTPLDGSYRVGNLILLVGAVVFSIYTILAKRATVRYDALTLNVVSYLMGSLLLAPVMAVTLPGFDWGAVSTSGWLGPTSWFSGLRSPICFSTRPWTTSRQLVWPLSGIFNPFLPPDSEFGCSRSRLPERGRWPQ